MMKRMEIIASLREDVVLREEIGELAEAEVYRAAVALIERQHEALAKIAVGEGIYGLQAGEYKRIARAALQDEQP